MVAAAFYRLLKTLRYENVNGDQDKSADEEMLIDAQTDRIENALKKWGSQVSLQSVPMPTELPARSESRIWPLAKRPKETKNGLKMYRISESGLGRMTPLEETGADQRRNTVAIGGTGPAGL